MRGVSSDLFFFFFLPKYNLSNGFYYALIKSKLNYSGNLCQQNFCLSRKNKLFVVTTLSLNGSGCVVAVKLQKLKTVMEDFCKWAHSDQAFS